MTNTMSTSVVDALRWRYATKTFDPSKKIPSDVWRQLEQALVLSPSSFGMQPYKFVVVTDQGVKDKLSAACGQTQPKDCSHLVVFCRDSKVDEGTVQRLMDRIVQVRDVPADSLTQYKGMMVGFVNSRSAEQLADWAARQAYIALGNLMTSAALLHVDNCPMEGFDPKKFDEILELPSKGLHSVVLCALGYRAADDKYARLAKVRMTEEQLFVRV